MKLRKITDIASDSLLIIAFINGLAFYSVSVMLGGTAFNGSIIGENYNLGSGGVQTSVSSTIYYYSFWHGVSFVSILFIAIVATGVNQLLWRGKPESTVRKATANASVYDYLVLVGAFLFSGTVIALIIWAAWNY